MQEGESMLLKMIYLNSCKSRHVSNAVLDVYRTEPLPKNHRFWQQDNIRLWPHVAAETNPDTAAKQIANAIKCIDNNIVPPNTVNRIIGLLNTLFYLSIIKLKSLT